MVARLHRYTRLLIALCLTSSLAACALLQPRDPLNISVIGIEPLPGQELELRMAVKMRVQNPNEEAIDYNGIALDLEVNGQPLAAGVSDQQGHIGRYDEAVIVVPVSITAFSFLRQAYGLGQVGTLQGLHSDNPWLARRHARLQFALGQQCERLGEWDQAMAVYGQCSHAQARIRQVRVLERTEQWPQAHALALQLAAAPANALEVQALERMLPRLARKLGGPPQRRQRATPLELIELELPREYAALGVEEAVRQHLAQEGGQAHYVENTLFNSLFGLLCWEAIFAPVPGAFFNPFQAAPQDLHDSDFQQRRSALFDLCLGRLDDGSHRQAILECYKGKQGLQSPFVFWSMLSEALLEQALACLPAAQLKQCFLRLLQDIRSNRAGMPDLIQFWPEQGRYRMVEVKGPGDRLQDNQLRWLEFCRQHGLPVAVCHVRGSETP